MKKFIVACYWQEYGEFEVEANSLNEAIALVEEGKEGSGYSGLPRDPEYVDGSFEVNVEVTQELNAKDITS
jgi:hypothetical protein